MLHLLLRHVWRRATSAHLHRVMARLLLVLLMLHRRPVWHPAAIPAALRSAHRRTVRQPAATAAAAAEGHPAPAAHSLRALPLLYLVMALHVLLLLPHPLLLRAVVLHLRRAATPPPLLLLLQLLLLLLRQRHLRRSKARDGRRGVVSVVGLRRRRGRPCG